MKKFEIKTETIERNVITSILCNLCGNECINNEGYTNYVSCRAAWGYGSRSDGVDEYAEFCETCWLKIKIAFIVPPKYDDGEDF